MTSVPFLGVDGGEGQRIAVEVGGREGAGERSRSVIRVRHRAAAPGGRGVRRADLHGDRDVDDATVPIGDGDGEGILLVGGRGAVASSRRGAPRPSGCRCTRPSAESVTVPFVGPAVCA